MSKSENNNQKSKKEESKINNKDSKNPIQNKKPDETKVEEGTTISILPFLLGNKELEKNGLECNLNLENNIPKDTISTSTGTESNNSQQENNSTNSKITFVGKIKQRAGSFWNSIKKINIKNMFPKEEYIEYRNANGDIVKIPKKKIPLKKKKKTNKDANNKIPQEESKVVNVYNYNNAATQYYLIS